MAMKELESLANKEDWAVLVSFLPGGWQEKAKELGALRRCRRFADAGVLLRALLMHLAEGRSLRETAAMAKAGGLVEVSDVALLKRLNASGEWLRWLCSELMREWVQRQPERVLGRELRLRVIDGSMIKEPGPTGSSWRLHYAISLPSLHCEQVLVTDSSVGESFERFTVSPGEVFVGDRVYGVARSMAHVLERGGQVLVRLSHTNLPLKAPDGEPFDLLRCLRTLSGTQLGDWPVSFSYQGKVFSGRLCAVKKSAAAAEQACKKARRAAQKHGYRVSAETLEAARYVFVFTTLPRKPHGPKRILELYRGRWQIELVFKRMKSIIGLGHLPKTSPDGIRAWIHGKLFVAFLIEAMTVAGESFFPWGYSLCAGPQPKSLPVA
jgi:hypothetical protein